MPTLPPDKSMGTGPDNEEKCHAEAMNAEQNNWTNRFWALDGYATARTTRVVLYRQERDGTRIHGTVDLQSMSGGRICRSPTDPNRKVRCRERRGGKKEAATALRE